MEFDANEVHAVKAGLRLAIAEYERCAQLIGNNRTAEHFLRQADQARAIVDRIEQEHG